MPGVRARREEPPPAEKSSYRGKMVGFVFPVLQSVPTLTACENASLPLLIAGLPRREAYGRTREILDRVGCMGARLRCPWSSPEDSSSA
jgi:predicted ABC-type transport system involved in lysophospholipase L1 biosynthesis ATPase subunit